MSLKQRAIHTMQQMSALPLLPFSARLALAQRFRELRFFLPPGHQFIYDRYLGNVCVNIDTTYPIEVEMATGAYDLKTTAILQRFIQPQDVVMDVGANVGALTLLMAAIADQGRVIALEPGPTTLARLQANLALNPGMQSRVEIYGMGLADVPGELFWQADPNVPGNAGLLSSDGIKVPVATLDSFVQDLGLPQLDFVKIDVEGMEYEVFQGGMGAIAEFRPILYYETLAAFRQNRGFDIYTPIFARLQKLQYQHFAVAARGQLVAIDNLDHIQSPNTLAVPLEKFPRYRTAR